MNTSQPLLTTTNSRARKLLDKIEADIYSGLIKTENDLAEALFFATHEFIDTVGNPLMSPEEIRKDDQLVREKIEVPIAEASEDIEVAYEQLSSIRGITTQIFNLATAEVNGLKERVDQVTGLVNTLRIITGDSDKSFVWVGDSFNDKSKVDPSSSARVDINGGVVTLNPVESKSMTDNIVRAYIDKDYSEGGLPGNNLEIQSPGVQALTGTGKSPRPITYRDSNHTGSLVALWDGEPDTWFEWERLYVPVPQTTIEAGLSIVADPAGRVNKDIAMLYNWNCFVRWPGEEALDVGVGLKGLPLVTFEGNHIKTVVKRRPDPSKRNDSQIPFKKVKKEGEREDLTLGITIELSEAMPVSWVQLTPLIKEGLYPTVEQILISNDGEVWKALLETPTTLHPRMNRGISFEAEGVVGNSFEGVGVWSLPSTPIKYIKIYLKQESAYKTKYGIAHRFYYKQNNKKKKNDWRGRTKGPVTIVGDFASAPGDTPDPTYGEQELKPALRDAFDILEADRQVIAIRDFLLEQRVYDVEGTFLSKTWTLEKEINVVGLLANEIIPIEWPDTDEDGRPWIMYEISPDGTNWYSITPQNSDLDDTIVTFPVPTKTIQLRATFSRPEDRETETATLSNYALKMIPV